jgi:hypothetical protein
MFPEPPPSRTPLPAARAPLQLLEDKQARGKVELISRLMDEEVERLVGYAPLARSQRDALTAAADRIMAAVANPVRPRAGGG